MFQLFLVLFVLALSLAGGYVLTQALVTVDTPQYLVKQDSDSEQNIQNEELDEQANEASDVVRGWIESEAPTYVYDGSELELQEFFRQPEDECAECYRFTFSFQSSHGGYGDRSGQTVTQAVTSHIIEIWFQDGVVVNAVTDGAFNEMTGELIPEEERMAERGQKEVQVYFYNPTADRNGDGYTECSADALRPVNRKVSEGSPVADALGILILGDITDEEVGSGFTANYAGEVELGLLTFSEDGVLKVGLVKSKEFMLRSDCQAKLLDEQIRKTAMQFKEVSEVVIERADPNP